MSSEFAVGSVEIYTSLDKGLVTRWYQLQDAGASTPFQSLDVIIAWFHSFARGGDIQPLIIIVSDRDGRDALLIPLIMRKSPSLTVIQFPDLGAADYNAPIIRRDLTINAQQMRAIWKDAVAKLPAADIIHLEKMPPQIAGRDNPMAYLSGAVPMTMQAFAVTLPECFEHYETAVLSKNMRSKLRRIANKCEREGYVEFVEARSNADVDGMLDVLFAQRAARFAELGRHNVLSQVDFSTFYRTIARSGLAGGPARLSALKINGEIVATVFGLLQDKRFYMLIPTFAGGSWASYSLGHVLFHKHMKNLHAEDCRVYDFTIGDEPYKLQYATTPTRLLEMSQPLSFRAAPEIFKHRARHYVRRSGLMEVLRPVARRLRASVSSASKASSDVTAQAIIPLLAPIGL